MAKDTTKKPKKAAAAPRARSAKPAPKAAKAAKAAPKVSKVTRAAKVKKVVKGAKKLAKNPATTEIVAATLVAAAAALRDPKKARALANEAADDLKKAAKSGVEGGALWQLALDVARRSIDAIGKENDGKGKKAKKAGAKKAKK